MYTNKFYVTFFQSIFAGNPIQKYFLSTKSLVKYPPVNCSSTCPPKFYVNHKLEASAKTCPDYFRWIYEDLKYWKKTGITKEMVEKGIDVAHFRLVIVNGSAYVQKYKKRVFQSRDVITLWGIMQLLRLYPGQLPDLDLMFECGDRPKILRHDYDGSKDKFIPPMFHYCGDDSSFDIVFPDWSFWGW